MHPVGRREDEVMCVFKIIKKAATDVTAFLLYIKGGRD